MQITPKYTVRQNVFLIRVSTDRVTVPCSACAGQGSILARDGQPYTCPRCGGSKLRLTGFSPKYEPDHEPHDVLSITTITNALGTEIVYLVGGHDGQDAVLAVEESRAFGTLEAAAAEAQRLTTARFASFHGQAKNLDVHA